LVLTIPNVDLSMRKALFQVFYKGIHHEPAAIPGVFLAFSGTSLAIRIERFGDNPNVSSLWEDVIGVGVKTHKAVARFCTVNQVTASKMKNTIIELYIR